MRSAPPRPGVHRGRKRVAPLASSGPSRNGVCAQSAAAAWPPSGSRPPRTEADHGRGPLLLPHLQAMPRGRWCEQHPLGSVPHWHRRLQRSAVLLLLSTGLARCTGSSDPLLPRQSSPGPARPRVGLAEVYVPPPGCWCKAVVRGDGTIAPGHCHPCPRSGGSVCFVSTNSSCKQQRHATNHFGPAERYVECVPAWGTAAASAAGRPPPPRPGRSDAPILPENATRGSSAPS